MEENYDQEAHYEDEFAANDATESKNVAEAASPVDEKAPKKRRHRKLDANGEPTKTHSRHKKPPEVKQSPLIFPNATSERNQIVTEAVPVKPLKIPGKDGKDPENSGDNNDAPAQKERKVVRKTKRGLLVYRATLDDGTQLDMDEDFKKKAMYKHLLLHGVKKADIPDGLQDSFQTPPTIGLVPTTLIVNFSILFVYIAEHVYSFARSKGWFGGDGWGPVTESLIDAGPVHANSVRVDGEYWRVCWAMFTHTSIMHILSNLGTQGPIMAMLEPQWGKYRVLGIFYLPAVVGNLCAVTADACNYTMGCSGGVYGTIGALFPYLYETWRKQKHPIVIAIGAVCVAGLGMYLTVSNENVSNPAHIGGFVCGILFGFATIDPPTVKGTTGLQRKITILGFRVRIINLLIRSISGTLLFVFVLMAVGGTMWPANSLFVTMFGSDSADCQCGGSNSAYICSR